MNKLVYLGLSICDFWYDYIKQNMLKMQNFVIWLEIVSMFMQKHDLYKDIAEDVGKRFNTCNFEIYRLLPTGKNKKVNGSMNDKLGGQTIKKSIGLRAKTYSYLKDSNDENKKAKGRKT